MKSTRFFDVIGPEGSYVSARTTVPVDARAFLPLSRLYRLPIAGIFLRGYWAKKHGARLDGPLSVAMPWRRTKPCA